MDNKRRIKIIGTGFYVPDQILTNADLERIVDTTDEWIVSRSGIRERHIAAADQATSDLCVEAGRRALKNAHLEVKDIDLILVANNTPDTVFPATACWVQAKLEAGTVPALDLIAGCTGFLYGLIVAEGLILSGAARRILLIGGDALSKVTNWKDRGTCVLLGDGAGAVVLEESKDDAGILSSYWKADGTLAELLFIPAGGSRRPASLQTVAEDGHYMYMKGNEVYKHAVKRMSEAVEEALKKAGLKKDDIDVFLPHQANLRIIEAVGERLKIPGEKVYVNIERYGNMSVACIPVAIHELRQHKRLKPGTVTVLAAFGAGFTWASIVYRW
ncbi:MAG: beta-ketoacyl-ACP synthase III [Candidatus Aminicenantes bacterium]|nr:beta-ketoacyl-ACP synthase III [Candidatus Aminicenantes bacterium]